MTKMAYVNAFLLAGTLCFICQLLLIYTKLGVPKILILAFTIGAILTAIGIMSKLTAWGGAGMFVMIVDAGEVTFRGTIAALSGNFTAIITLLFIICAVTVIATLTALFYLKIKGTQADS